MSQSHCIHQLVRQLRTKAIYFINQFIGSSFQYSIIIIAHGNNFRKILQQAFIICTDIYFCCRILSASLTNINRPRSNRRIHRYGFNIIVQMTTNNQVHAAPFSQRCNIPVIKNIRIWMMCYQNTPSGVSGRFTCQVSFNPLQRSLYLFFQ